VSRDLLLADYKKSLAEMNGMAQLLPVRLFSVVFHLPVLPFFFLCSDRIQEHTPKGSAPFEIYTLDEKKGIITRKLLLPLPASKTDIRHFIVQVDVDSEQYKQLMGVCVSLAEVLLSAARERLHELTHIPIADMEF
jgi:hypothetical protein